MSGDLKSKKIVVFGGIFQDMISYASRFPLPGETINGYSFHTGPGGCGANQAIAAALLGADVAMIGKVGNDAFGVDNINAIAKSGVDVTAIETCKDIGTSTCAIVVAVDANGENSGVCSAGANTRMTEKTAEENEQLIASAGFLICQSEIPDAATRRALEIARTHGVTTYLNPVPSDPKMDKSMLQLVDIICVNENEAEFITGISAKTEEEAMNAARSLIALGVKNAIVTLGPRGCILAESQNDSTVIDPVHIPAETVTAVDTTGAGDCFCGSLVALLSTGKLSLKEAVRRAGKIASLSVQIQGTQCSYSSRGDIILNGRSDIFEGI